MPGITDRAAIIGVGCTKFGGQWEKDQEDLLVEASPTRPWTMLG